MNLEFAQETLQFSVISHLALDSWNFVPQIIYRDFSP